jgi:hypothetical protein
MLKHPIGRFWPLRGYGDAGESCHSRLWLASLTLHQPLDIVKVASIRNSDSIISAADDPIIFPSTFG